MIYGVMSHGGLDNPMILVVVNYNSISVFFPCWWGWNKPGYYCSRLIIVNYSWWDSVSCIILLYSQARVHQAVRGSGPHLLGSASWSSRLDWSLLCFMVVIICVINCFWFLSAEFSFFAFKGWNKNSQTWIFDDHYMEFLLMYSYVNVCKLMS